MTFKSFPNSDDFYNKSKKIYLKNLFFLLEKIENHKEKDIDFEFYTNLNSIEKENESDMSFDNDYHYYFRGHIKHCQISPAYFKQEPTYYEILSNLQISCELMLKKYIFDVSPYALINMQSYSGKNKEIDFLEFSNFDSQHFYDACIFLIGSNVFSNQYNINFKDIYDESRIERNSYIHREQNKETENFKYGLKILRYFIIVNDIFFKLNLRKTIYKQYKKLIPDKDYKNKNNNFKRCSRLSLDRYDEGEIIHEVFYEKMRAKYLHSIYYIKESLIDSEIKIFFKLNIEEDIKEYHFCPNCTLHYNIYINSSNFKSDKIISSRYNKDSFLKSLININNNMFKCLCCNDIYTFKKKQKHFSCNSYIFNKTCLGCGEENIKNNNYNINLSDDSLFLLRKKYRKKRILKV